MNELLIFAVVNTLAAALSGVAGGGGGLISTPFLVLLGLPPSTAISTAKFGGFGLSVGSSARFFKEKITNKRTLVFFSALSVIGAVIGSLLLVEFSGYEAMLERIMGAIILLAGIPLLYFKNMGLKTKSTSWIAKLNGSVLLLVVLVLHAAIGSGIGMLQLVILMSCFGMTAIVASATRRIMQLIVTSISLVVFIAAGLVDFQFGFVAMTTPLVGGFIGTHLAIKKGNKFIVNLFAIISAVLAIQLIL